MIYVIGSGPAGVSCAKALLDRGVSVHMLDAGITLEEPQQAAVRELASTPPEQWDSAPLARIKMNMQATTEGIPQKAAFGSTFPYQQTGEFIPRTLDGAYLLPSLARGGLSNVWGAAVLPFRAEEIADWPVSLRQLEPHYQAVTKFMPLSAARDDLEALFPLYADTVDELRLSSQARVLLERLASNRQMLKNAGIHFGRSRLAVRGQTKGSEQGCVYCGLCMYGCPYRCIYCSDQTLRILQEHPHFRYERDVVVQRLEEKPEAVVIHAEHRLTRQPLSFTGIQVFLAAGILPSTQILLESLRAYDHTLPMGYSQHFMFPMLSAEGEPSASRDRLHTLAQVFLEMFDAGIGPESVHLQVYTFNDLYEKALKESVLGPFLKVVPKVKNWALGKLLVVQGYLHSRYSSPIQLHLKMPGVDTPARLFLKGTVHSAVGQKVRRVVKKLKETRGFHGGFPLAPWLKISPPGQGFHNVGTFPMRETPGPFESDRWGRPHGFKKVHVVDATVLPSAPATTITFSVMANAHRIGSATLDDE